MTDPERTGHVLHQPSGDISVTITGQDPERPKAEVIFSSPEGGSPEDFEAILKLVEAEVPKRRGELARLASTIKNLKNQK